MCSRKKNTAKNSWKVKGSISGKIQGKIKKSDLSEWEGEAEKRIPNPSRVFEENEI